MAILWAGGEDEGVTGTFSVDTTTTYFDTATSRCSLHAANGQSVLSPAFTAAGEFWVHAAWYFRTAVWGNVTFLELRRNGAPYIRLQSSTSENLVFQIFSGGSWSSLGTAGAEFSGFFLRTIDLRVNVHASTGALELYVGGGLYKSVSGNTLGDNPDGLIDQIVFGTGRATSGNGDHWSQMLVMDEDTRGHKVYACPPTGDGANAGWTGAWTDVDEITNSDADALTSGTAGQKETLAFANLPTLTGPIKGAVVSTRAGTSGGAPTQLRHLARNGATDYNGATKALTAAGPVQTVFGTNPGTAAAWTKAEFDAAEFGFESIT